MRVLVADDHVLVRTGIRLLLETISGVRVVGEAVDGREAVDKVAELRPDCVLMDLAMPGMSGLDAVRLIAAQYAETRVLVLSMHADEAYVQNALAAGASGYLLKGADKAELEHALAIVARGEIYLSPSISRAIVSMLANTSIVGRWAQRSASLTPRQVEVLRLVAAGLSTKQVAGRLGVSAKTIEAHRAAIMDRLNIRDLAGLVRYAMREGLVEDPPKGKP